VTALVGSSVNFTWSFSDDVNQVNWGLKKSGVNESDFGELLVSLDVNGTLLLVSVPASYTGRVNGSRSGNLSFGQAIFTLSSITKDDERFYGCQLNSTSPSINVTIDFVQLFVQGG